MAEPFIGQIIQGGWTFAPRGYATCGGQLMQIAQNSALFSLLGTSFGGNGQTTFGVPNLLGRTMIGAGNGAGWWLASSSGGTTPCGARARFSDRRPGAFLHPQPPPCEKRVRAMGSMIESTKQPGSTGIVPARHA